MMRCPVCGNENMGEDRHYYYCVKIGNRGCNALWAKDEYTYFTGLYIIDELGIKAYRQTAQEGGGIIKTEKILPAYKKRGLNTL